jgi:hypothetical protein
MPTVRLEDAEDWARFIYEVDKCGKKRSKAGKLADGSYIILQHNTQSYSWYAPNTHRKKCAAWDALFDAIDSPWTYYRSSGASGWYMKNGERVFLNKDDETYFQNFYGSY